MLVTLFLTLPLCADNASLESQLKSEFVGKRFFIAGFQKGSKLNFDSAGNLAGRSNPGVWTEGALVEVSKVKVRKDRVEITGRRHLIAFQPTKETCSGVCLPEPRTFEDAGVSIRVALDASATDQKIHTAIVHVLADSHASIMDAVPQHWKLFACRLEAQYLKQDDSACWDQLHLINLSAALAKVKSGLLLSDGERVPLGKVDAPKAVFSPDPGYAEVARQHRFSGTSVWMIAIDESGVPRSLYITRPCGMGLDEKAYEVLQTWRFKPAIREGKPISVIINVEVNFRLY